MVDSHGVHGWDPNKKFCVPEEVKAYRTAIIEKGNKVEEEWKGKLPQEATLLLILDGLWRQLEQSEQTEKEILVTASI